MRILHLTDLHFGTLASPESGEQISKHAFQDYQGRPDPTGLVNVLRRGWGDNAPNFVVLSGDLGWSGSEEDYSYALQFLIDLRNLWKNTQLVIIPGNHDVDQQVAREGVGDPQAAFFEMLRQFYGSDFNTIYPLFKSKVDPPPLRERLVTCARVPGEILILAVNTAAWLGQHGYPVCVSPAILEQIENSFLSGADSEREIRVFIGHHHLFPFFENPRGDVYRSIDVPEGLKQLDTSMVSNSGELQAWLASHKFHVALHGHKHAFHARRDTLWRQQDASGLELLVIGCGSSGVIGGHREQSEMMAYNVIDIHRLANARWAVHIGVQSISKAMGGAPRSSRSYADVQEVGQPVDRPQRLFAAEWMDHCHQAIAEALDEKGLIHNFISIVENASYRHPPSARIGERDVSKGEIESTFHTLHPEYDWRREMGWDDQEFIEDSLKTVPPRFQFQHGPRLFGALGRAGTRTPGTQRSNELQPIRRALKSLESGSATRAYVGLYNADTDVTSDRQPLPGLVGLQFIPDGTRLDVVATFRKIELSYWWCVNMLEIGELLSWACGELQERKEPGRVTFIAAVAEWKRDPERLFVARLDDMSLAKMAILTNRVALDHQESIKELESLLGEKLDNTNEVNLDASGLNLLLQLLQGMNQLKIEGEFGGATRAVSSEFLSALQQAANEIANAIEGDVNRRASIRRAQDQLRYAIQLLAASQH